MDVESKGLESAEAFPTVYSCQNDNPNGGSPSSFRPIDMIIYHKRCHDGFASYVVAMYWMKLNAPEALDTVVAIECQYGDEAPSCEGKNVVVFDYSFSNRDVSRMKEEAASFLLFDHHASAYERLKNESNCHFDMDKSGAMLAWNFFFPYERTVPNLISYVQDKDLYLWKLPKSREYFAGLESKPFDLSIWMDLLCDNIVSTMKLIDIGSILFPYKMDLVKTISEKSLRIAWIPKNKKGEQVGKEYSVHLVSTPIFINEVGETLYGRDDCDIAIMWRYFMEEKKYVLCFRSKDVDVSKIVKHYGGGGHPGAAGCSWEGDTLEAFFGTFKIMNEEK